MFLQFLLILFVCVVVLYFKFLYVPLPSEITDRGALRIIMALSKLFLVYPFRLLDFLNLSHYKCLWMKHVRVQLFKIVKLWIGNVPTFDNITKYDTTYDGVPVRVYIPARELRTRNLNGSILFIHGGGWVIGSLDSIDLTVQRMVNKAGCPAVSIGYSKAPEHPFPQGLDECERAVIFHLRHGAAALHVDPSLTVLMGDSAGGNLTAVIVQRLVKRRRDGLDVPMLKASVPIYPVIQCANLCLPSYQEEKATSIGLLATDVMHQFHMAYFGVDVTKDMFTKLSQNQHLGDSVKHHPAYKWLDKRLLYDSWVEREAQLKLPKELCDNGKVDTELAKKLEHIITDPDYSPIFADDLRDTPSTMVITCEYDVLRDEGALYAGRLRAEGVDAKLAHYSTTYHGIITMPTPTSDKIMTDIADFVKQKCRGDDKTMCSFCKKPTEQDDVTVCSFCRAIREVSEIFATPTARSSTDKSSDEFEKIDM